MQRPLLLFLLIVSVWFISIQPANGSLTYMLQVGAYGDASSIGNRGVRAEIRTHTYQVNPQGDNDAFWVGVNLEQGAFIQFGYIMGPAGNYCSSAEMVGGTPIVCLGNFQTVNDSETLWFWQYWPNGTGNKYYYGVGRSESVGVNGTWHVYGIEPDSNGEWGFQLDGQQVASANFQTTESSGPAFFVAEKTALSEALGSLGPVEFRNLAYLKQDGWHQVTALYAIVSCGLNSHCIPIPYGVTVLTGNHIIAGTSVTQPKDGELLWNGASSSTETSFIATTSQLARITPRQELLFGLTVILLTIILVNFAGRKRAGKS